MKLVGLDLDGTTLGPDHLLLDRTREAIFAAQSRGVRVVIVTGRMYQSALPIARDLKLEGLPMATYNGAAVYEYPSGRLLYHEPLALDACKKIAAFCEARGLHLNAYVDDQLYVPDLGERTQRYIAVAGVKAHPVGSVFLWLSKPSTKMLIVDEPERIQAVRPELKALLGPGFHITSSIPDFLEITSERATKGIALEWIANSLGISREETMAVGDAYNDLTMLRWAGTSFAMTHSPDEVKRAATYVAQGGPGLGVVDALERMGLA
jgi:Cof subfamily protein (haloacid dehalogenase superfamily)